MGYSKRKGNKGVYQTALAATNAERVLEDPQLFYIKRVLKKKEPMAMPLLIGIAFHEAMEELLAPGSPEANFKAAGQKIEEIVHEKWSELEDTTIFVNEEDPTNPRRSDKTEKETTPGETVARLKEAFKEPMWRLVDPGYYPSTPFRSHVPGKCDLERSIGELALRGGMPRSEATGFDPRAGKVIDYPTAVIGGVPFKGYVDFLGEHPYGGDMLLDFKAVSQVVRFYPTWNGGRKVYSHSYDVADSIQLNVYQGGSAAERAGYEFFTKLPQYSEQALHPDWHYEEYWEGNGFPMDARPSQDGNLHWVCVWRPCSLDHDRAKDSFPIARIRAAFQARRAAETITEGLLLLERGVEPEIAFPPGEPEEIAKKACPYCYFGENGTGICASPREDTEASREEWRETWETREELCKEHLSGLREEWKGRYGSVGGGLAKGPFYPHGS